MKLCQHARSANRPKSLTAPGSWPRSSVPMPWPASCGNWRRSCLTGFSIEGADAEQVGCLGAPVVGRCIPVSSSGSPKPTDSAATGRPLLRQSSSPPSTHLRLSEEDWARIVRRLAIVSCLWQARLDRMTELRHGNLRRRPPQSVLLHRRRPLSTRMRRGAPRPRPGVQPSSPGVARSSEGRGGLARSKLGKRAGTDGWGRDPIAGRRGWPLRAEHGGRIWPARGLRAVSIRSVGSSGRRPEGNQAGSAGLILEKLRVVNVKKPRRTRTTDPKLIV